MQTREEFEEIHGQVWDTRQLQEDFMVHSFAAPFVIVTKKETGKKGSLMFTHNPRYYYGWQEN